MKQSNLKYLRDISDTAKKLDESVEKLSANDLMVSKYIALGEAMKFLKEELDALEVDLLHRGDFSTKHYVVTIVEQEKRKAPSRELLEKMYGKDRINPLLKAPTVTALDKEFGKPEIEKLCKDNNLISVSRKPLAKKKS